MKKLASQEVLDQLKKDTQEITATVKNEFLVHTTEKLQQKPMPNSWSVLECLEHLNLTYRHYIPEIQNKLKQATAQQKVAISFYKPSILGNYMTNSMMPKGNQVVNKMKTFAAIQPSLDETSEIIIKEFLEHQQSMLDLLDTASGYNLQRIKVQSLVKILRFRLGDAFRFLTAHNLRHILQAKKALIENGAS